MPGEDGVRFSDAAFFSKSALGPHYQLGFITWQTQLIQDPKQTDENEKYTNMGLKSVTRVYVYQWD